MLLNKNDNHTKYILAVVLQPLLWLLFFPTSRLGAREGMDGE